MSESDPRFLADSLSVPITNFSVLERNVDSRWRNQFAYSHGSGVFVVKILLEKREGKFSRGSD
jgi:hypothetical protein